MTHTDLCQQVPRRPLECSSCRAPGKRFEIKFANSKWEISDNGIAVGYFPGSLWKSFTPLGLVQRFGEVSAATSRPCSQMGNGRFAGRPAHDKITGMRLIGGPAVSFSLTTTEPAHYTARKTSGTAIRFGGPSACLP
jgi:Neprosin